MKKSHGTRDPFSTQFPDFGDDGVIDSGAAGKSRAWMKKTLSGSWHDKPPMAGSKVHRTSHGTTPQGRRAEI